MKIFVAEDDIVSLRLLTMALERGGHEVVGSRDGAQLWAALQEHGRPVLALVDWMMPEMDGLAVCRRIRRTPVLAGSYLILVTARAFSEDLVAGLDAGADDYVTKPFDHGELAARVRVGQRLLRLQAELVDRNAELSESLRQVRVLEGLLPICAHCKKIRDDADEWKSVEEYLHSHSDVSFTHGICPTCLARETRPT